MNEVLNIIWASITAIVLGNVPAPTLVNTYEEAVDCFKSGRYIVGVYQGATPEEAAQNQKNYCIAYAEEKK